MGRIISDGIDYSGLVFAEGCFIDADNVIVPLTEFASSLSYTAQTDCYMCFYLVGRANTTTRIRIDGESVYEDWQSSLKTYGTGLFVKKGQVVEVENVDTTYTSVYYVYGIQQGSPITFLSEYASACYSDTEREVGCWVDGKPLYQKTVHIGNLTFDTSWHLVAHGITNIDKVISCEGIMFGVDGEVFPLPNYRSNTNQGIVWGIQGLSSEYVAYINNWYNSTNDAYATLRYTKTTDTAGSGHLTPTGTPTVHYSTNEQIVGTWIDGKPLYEKTWVKTVPNSSGFFSWSDSVLADIETVVETKYSVRNVGQQGATPWYSGASVYFDAMGTNEISFYFDGTYNAGSPLIFTAQYTKTTD